MAPLPPTDSRGVHLHHDGIRDDPEYLRRCVCNGAHDEELTLWTCPRPCLSTFASTWTEADVWAELLRGAA